MPEALSEYYNDLYRNEDFSSFRDSLSLILSGLSLLIMFRNEDREEMANNSEIAAAEVDLLSPSNYQVNTTAISKNSAVSGVVAASISDVQFPFAMSIVRSILQQKPNDRVMGWVFVQF